MHRCRASLVCRHWLLEPLQSAGSSLRRRTCSLPVMRIVILTTVVRAVLHATPGASWPRSQTTTHFPHELARTLQRAVERIDKNAVGSHAEREIHKLERVSHAEIRAPTFWGISEPTIEVFGE